MCFGSRICMCCICLVLLAVVIGMLFGFGVFKNGFHKIKNTVDICDPAVHGSLCGSGSGRPFLSYPAPPPF